MADWLGLLGCAGGASVAQVLDLLRPERAAWVGVLDGLALLFEGGLGGLRLGPVDEGARLFGRTLGGGGSSSRGFCLGLLLAWARQAGGGCGNNGSGRLIGEEFQDEGRS